MAAWQFSAFRNGTSPGAAIIGLVGPSYAHFAFGRASCGFSQAGVWRSTQMLVPSIPAEDVGRLFITSLALALTWDKHLV